MLNGLIMDAYSYSPWGLVQSVIPGQPKRRPLRGRLLQYSIDIRGNYARLRRENAP